MRSLFWKIFGWFWAAMVLIGLALYLVVLTTRPDPLPAQWRETAGTATHNYAVSAAQAWEREGRRALFSYLSRIGQRSHSAFWLFDVKGRELSGLPIPPPPPDPKLLPPPYDPPSVKPSGPLRSLETPQRLQTMRRRALQEKLHAVFQLAGPRVLLAQEVVTSTSKRYVLVGSMPTPHFERVAAEPRQQLLGGLALLCLSTLVCYGLVRYLTAPLIELREATRKLASGDLSARTGAAHRKRRDEVADLGRDFDAMAQRIEVLMTSQRRLLGDVSHELRSPLARLSMALGLARHYAAHGNTAELEEIFDRIAREKERLNELIGQLLELARLESGECPAPSQSIDLQALLKEIVEDAYFEASALDRAVRVTRAVPCHIFGSPELLRRAIENIVRNAVAYTPPNTTVEVSLDTEGEYCVLRVRDYGTGVPEEALDKLFQPFYRVASARERQSGGVGLGLAITERAIASHGGTVSARNAADGGLEIEMRLPIYSNILASA